MPSKKSGGKRAVEKKHQARTAQRPKNYEAQRTKRLKAIGPPPSDVEAKYVWLTQILAQDIWDAENDKGLPPEARRTQTAQLAPQLTKALEPARLTVKLDALERENAELRERLREVSARNAPAFDPAEDSGPRSPAQLS